MELFKVSENKNYQLTSTSFKNNYIEQPTAGIITVAAKCKRL